MNHLGTCPGIAAKGLSPYMGTMGTSNTHTGIHEREGNIYMEFTHPPQYAMPGGSLCPLLRAHRKMQPVNERFIRSQPASLEDFVSLEKRIRAGR